MGTNTFSVHVAFMGLLVTREHLSNARCGGIICKQVKHALLVPCVEKIVVQMFLLCGQECMSETPRL